MTASLAEISWPASRLGEALVALGRAGRLGTRAVEVSSPPPALVTDGGGLGRWIEAAAAWLGVEAEPVEALYPEVHALVCEAGPALLRLPPDRVLANAPTEARFLVLVGGGGRRVTLLTPGLITLRLRPEAVRAALCQVVEAPVASDVEQILAGAGVRGRHRQRARQALLRELLAARRVGGCWLLRPAGATGLLAQAREARLPQLLAALLGAHAISYGLWVLSWGLLGWMALQGRFEPGWLLAWLLLLLTLIPFHLLSTAAGGRLAIRAGTVLKRRLLEGALKLERDDVRHQGAGQLLGRVIESEVVESTALAGGFLSLTASLELLLAGVTLALGAGSWLHVVLLLGWVAVTVLLARRLVSRRRRWTQERLDMTNDLVERMVGHRTRLAQEPRAYWNEGEDQALERYLETSADLDRSATTLQVVVPRGWFLAGLLGLAPAFLAGEGLAGAGPPVTALAVGVGGVILAYRAFRSLAEGLERLAAAAIAWEYVQPLWQAAARQEPPAHPGFAILGASGGCEPPGQVEPGASQPPLAPLLEGRDLVFRYPGRAEPVLKGVDVRIRAGDRMLLQGQSGGGKSTLAALLTGCRQPASGLLLFRGLDRETLGAESWRRRVVLAPQFHDNHVLMGTFAFNALLGRGWPPRSEDLADAERVCCALGLGPLLKRMPAGLQQMVGETGWQLSHGEKSRLYLARALLQGADLLILDESFAALDPQTLRHTLAFVLETAPTVLVIAHP
ncbi:MAG: ABC transporter ATP-binding protein [Planctomycetes bacterium]|nr:ABC transporter ATP-binding protein [Planctomycetota bacterium]